MLKRLLSTALRSSWSKRTADLQQAQVSVFLERASEAQRRGDITAAEAALRQGAALYPAMVLPLACLAELLCTAGRDTEALQAYERALEIQPQQPELRFNYAGVLKRLGDHAKADRVYAQLSEQQPDWAPPYINRGVLAFEQSQWKKAFALLERAAKLAPDNAQVPRASRHDGYASRPAAQGDRPL